MKPILSHALRELGLAALLRFGQYRLGLNSGWIRRQTSRYGWGDRPLSTWLKARYDADAEGYSAYRLSAAPKLFLPEKLILQNKLKDVLGSHAENAIAAADEIGEGVFTLFGFHKTDLGFPPDWHRFAPLLDQPTTQRAPSDIHWSSIDLTELASDVKLVWEINRFGWVFALARAYALSGDQRYFEFFWRLVDSWRAANPPNSGINWYSAQEVSIRMLALIFAIYAMEPEFERHPQRLASVVQMVAAHAERIPPTLSYAIAQGNNHLLVEAAGLYSVGVLFPEFRQAGRWRRIGSRWLIRALHEQVFADGGYVQHSVNYHRVALQAALWSARLADMQGAPLPEATLQQISTMNAWLAALVDPQTGSAPNLGPNDGAEILPLSSLPFDDHRPTLQAADHFLGETPAYGSGPWDEWSLWLGVLNQGDEVREPMEIEVSSALEASGIFRLSGKRARGFLRAAHFENRPGHADQLHLDLWFGPLNIAMDAGTYLYNAEAPWDNALSGGANHNSVLVDGSEAMIRAGRFLWLNWNQARLIGMWNSESGSLEAIAAERYADLEAQVLHRRTVIRAGDHRWTVIDDLLGGGRHQIDLRWLLPDLPWKLEGRALHLETPVGAVRLETDTQPDQRWIIRAGTPVHGENFDERSETLGWFSPTYALRIPALHLVSRWNTELPLRIRSDWIWAIGDETEIELELNNPSTEELPLEWVRHKVEYLEMTDAYSSDPSGIRRDR